MKNHHSSPLFTRPISRRMYYWLLFLCPIAVLVLHVIARSEAAAANESARGSSTVA